MKRPFLQLSFAFALLASASPRTLSAAQIEGLPEPAAPHPAKLAQPAEKTLANGLRVIVVERPGVPLLSASFFIKSGSEADPAKRSGLTNFMGDLMTQGTDTRSATQIAQDVEALGASIETETRWDALEVRLRTLSENAAPAFALLADVVRHPKFAPDEIERLRRQTLDDLRLAFQQPGQVARAVAARVSWQGTPYATPPMGTLASVPRLQRKDVLALHRRICVPANAILVMAGSVTADAGFALAEKAFGDWHAESAAVPDAKAPPAAAPAARAILVDFPAAGQAAVFVTTRTPARPDAAFLPSEVLNGVLGGGYSARLNQEIRVKRGLSYGAGSRLLPNRVGTLFAASCQTKNESAVDVVKTMQTEFARLLSEAVDAPYLNARKAVLSGDFARQFERNEGYVKALGELALYGLPLDALNTRIAALESIDAETIQKLATGHLAPASLQVVVVGRGKDIAAPLRALFPALEVIPHDQLDLDSETLGASRKRKN